MEAAFTALQDIMRRYGLRLDSNFVLAFKTLMQADQIIRALDPNILFTEVAVESSSGLLREQLNKESVGDMLSKQLSRSAREVAYRVPSLVDATTKWLDQYEKGRLTVYVDTSDLTPHVDKLDRTMTKSLDRLIVGLVLVGWLVGAAIASTADVNIGDFPLSDLAFYMFLIGAIVGGFVAFQALWRLRREDDEPDY
jgi:predicted unusual protein kinase regulating ubiquinone biosynthesis (AarF/ABC1/UbiB family)